MVTLGILYIGKKQSINSAGPKKYGERGNGVPRKLGTYQEVKANLTGRPKKIKKRPTLNEPN